MLEGLALEAALTAQGLLLGEGDERTLKALCDAGRLEGGLSVSCRALPEEVIGALVTAMGGALASLRVLDVRTQKPLGLEVQWKDVHEWWDVDGVPELVEALDELALEEPSARVLVDLGEHEGAWQLWCVPRARLAGLFTARLLDAARNRDLLLEVLEAG